MKKIIFAKLLILIFAFTICAQTAPQEKSVNVFGAKIRYLEAGDPSKPTVILLHGLGGNADGWAFNIPALAANYHVIAPDQVGFGKSDKPMIAYRVETYVDFLDKFMSELKIEKASLAGNSMGGWISALYALKNPTKVEKIVLVDAAGFAPPKNFDVNFLNNLNPSTREGTKALVKLIFANPALTTDAAVDQFITMLIAAGDGYTIQTLIESIKRGEGYLDGKAQNIKQPTLIIWGKQDGLVTLDNGERFDREIPNSTLIVFDQAGHVPQIEKAQEFNAAVLKFLAEK